MNIRYLLENGNMIGWVKFAPLLYWDCSNIGGKCMSGIIIMGVGIGMIVFAIILFIVSVAYRKTAGKRIREELGKEYG